MDKRSSSVMPTVAPEAPPPTHLRKRAKRGNRPMPKAGVWVTLAGVCVLGIVSFVVRRSVGMPATASSPAFPGVGAWTDGGEEWLVLSADGTGARTRPDPTWGTRRYTFRWQARGNSLQLTEQRVTFLGGSQATAGDASEMFSVASAGQTLTLGTLKFSRHKP